MALVLGVPSLGAALDVYVATTGSDKNPGTEALPKATIAAGLAKLPRGGGNLFIRGGTYPQSKTLNINVAGASNASRTTVRSYPGESAVIEGSEGNTVNIDASFVTLSGLEIRQAEPTAKGGYGILIWKQHDVTVSACTIHHTRTSGIFVGSDDYDPVAKTSTARGLLFEGNTVHHTNYNNSDQVKRPGWGQGVSSFFSVGTVYRNNKVYKNWGEGINLCCNDSALIEGNVVYDNYSVNIYLDHATNATVRGNLIYTSEENDRADFFPYWSKTTSPGNGILLANETQKQTNRGHKIYNNISIHCGSGVHVSGDLADTLIANNTFVIGSAWGIGFGGGEKAVNCTLKNNIFYTVGGRLGGPAKEGQWNSDYNLWFGGKPSATAGAHEIKAHPLFTVGTGLGAENYRLQPTSPAINSGTAIDEIKTDYVGTSRPEGAAYDIGAVEYTVARAAEGVAGKTDKESVKPSKTSALTNAKPAVRFVPLDGAVEAHKARLLTRLREVLAAGKKPTFDLQSLTSVVTVTEADPTASLRVTLKQGGQTSVKWAQFSAEDLLHLALALAALDDEPESHAVAAFYLFAANRAERAEDHVGRAGSLGQAVRNAFRKEGDGAPARTDGEQISR